MLTTIAFAISALSAFVILVLCMQGVINGYVGGPERVRVDIQTKLWYLVVFGFVAGCIFTVL